MDHFTVAANTAGERRTVAVHVYPTQAEMTAAAHHFTGPDAGLSTNTQALVNAWHVKQNPQAIIRLCHQHMHDHVFVHEIVHAAQTIYRWTNPHINGPAADHFNHYNEEFAHLVSDLYMGLKHGINARYTITTVEA